MEKSEKMDKKQICFLLLVIAIASTMPLLNDFMPYSGGHDLRFHLARIDGICEGLMAGEFPVYINSLQAHGYGYASPIMNPQLFLYIPAILHLLGLSLFTSYKWFVFLMNFATAGISFFSYGRIFCSDRKGMISASIYTFTIYRLVDIYTRAAIGECLALVFLPLIIYGMYECVWRNFSKWIWLAVGYACVIYSHVVSVEIYLGFCMLMALMGTKGLLKEKARILAILKAAGVAFLLSISFIIPWFSYRPEDFQVFSEKRYLGDSAIYISQMFNTFSMNYGGENVGRGFTQGEMPLSVGLIILFGVIAFLFFMLGKQKAEFKKETITRVGIGGLFLGIIGLWMSSNYFPWYQFHFEVPFHDILNKFLFPIQFAWRFLGAASAFLVLPATIGLEEILGGCTEKHGSKRLLLIILVIVAAAFPYLNCMTQSDTLKLPDKGYGVGWTDELYMYTGDSLSSLDEREKYHNQIESVGAQGVLVDNVVREGTQLSFNMVVSGMNDGDILLEVPVYYYPGYEADFNGTKLDVLRGDRGVIRIAVPNENGVIRIRFEEPLLWKAGNMISLLSLTAVVIWSGRTKVKNKKMTRIKERDMA